MFDARFVDFLVRPGWSARQGGETLDADRAGALVAGDCSRLSDLAPGADDAPLTVFCVATQLEALRAYFVASRLGLLAAVVQSRSLPHFAGGLGPNRGMTLVLSGGRKPPDVVRPEDRVVRLPAFASATAGGGSGAARRPRRPARLVFCTSGSTGAPKLVVCDESRLIANAGLVTNYLGLRPGDRTLCAFPITLMYGLSTTLCTLLSGGAIEYPGAASPVALAARVARGGVTVLPALGDWAAGLARPWEAAKFAPRRLILLNASDRLLVCQAERVRPFVTALWNNLGQTESGPRLFAHDLSAVGRLDDVAHDGVIAPGRPIDPRIELRFPSGCDAGGFGLLAYKTPFAMLGYLGADGRLRSAPEWIDSGDLFRRTPDGLWLWGGRDHNAIKVNGQYFCPGQLEQRLLGLDSVRGVAYAKGPDGDLRLFVQAERPSAGLIVLVRRLLRSAAVGDNVRLRLVPTLPRTPNGKIDVKRLTTDLINPITE